MAACQITHQCGHVLGTFSSPDDHGSFEIHCPKCKEWVEVFNQFFLNVNEEERTFAVSGDYGEYNMEYAEVPSSDE